MNSKKSSNRIVTSVKKVLEKEDIELLSKKSYEFIITHCGFIAHYSHDGFKGYYRKVRDFKEALRERIEYNEHYIRCNPEKVEVVDTMRAIIELVKGGGIKCSKKHINS